MSNKELDIVANLKIEESNVDKILEIRKKIISEPIELERIGRIVDNKYSDEQREIILKPFKDFCYENDIDYKLRDHVGEALYKIYGTFVKHRVENLKVYHLLNIGKKRLLRSAGVGPKALVIFQVALDEYDLSLAKPISDGELVYFDRLIHDKFNVKEYK